METNDINYKSLEEELYKYGKIIMDLSPATFLVILTSVAARIIREQNLTIEGKNNAILLSASFIAKASYL